MFSMISALVGLYHIFKFNLIINAILHGGLTFAIIKGFIIALIQWSLAHQSVAALLACSIFLATNGKGNNSKDLNGIFNYFQNKTSNHIEKEINFYSSSAYNINCRPRNVALFGQQDKFFLSQNFPNSWILFDFRDHKILPTNYTIRTISYFDEIHGSRHLKSWIVEGSSDNENWEIIDEQLNCEYLRKNDAFTFNIDENKSKEFNFIRLTQIDKNWEDDDYLAIESFEIFGVLDFLNLYQKTKSYFNKISSFFKFK